MEAEEYPEERGEALLDAADQWEQAGEPDRAYAIYDQLIAEDLGEDSQFARRSKAGLLYEEGRRAESDTELEILRRSNPMPGPAYMTGELLESQGRFKEALVWFEVAIGVVDATEFGGFDAGTLIASPEYNGRVRIRRALGMPEDELDRAVVRKREEFAELFDRFQEETGQARRREDPIYLFAAFVRADVQRAIAGGLVHADGIGGADSGADAYCRRVERYWRSRSKEAEACRLRVHPATVGGLLAFAEDGGLDPVDADTRAAHARQNVDAGNTVAWPPERNGLCWCGTGRKYKKCCGRPGT
ncbi:hypothetical protein GCM10022205_03400 [Spinactinospora alkalitolerans]